MCVLRVYGEHFDPQKFLEHSSLPAYESWCKGEPRRLGAKFYGRTHDEGGFKVNVSGKEWTDLQGQIADALEFLETFRRDLSALAASSDVEQVYLDFPFASPASAEPPIYQSVFLPPKLLALAGELGVGIEVSVYPQISKDAT